MNEMVLYICGLVQIYIIPNELARVGIRDTIHSH